MRGKWREKKNEKELIHSGQWRTIIKTNLPMMGQLIYKE